MIRIFLHKNVPSAWSRYVINKQEFFFKGKVFYCGSLIEGEKAAQMISSSVLQRDLLDILSDLNGSFALVIKDEGKIIAATDRVRGWPLFYGQSDGHFYVSDDAGWIRTQVGDQDMDPVSADEFYLSGYIVGEDTLYSRVKQIQSGHWLTFEHGHPVQRSYISYVYSESWNGSQDDFDRELDHIFHRVFSRLIQWAEGKLLVVPLSGGYDSRLIVVMLKKLGYKDILTFSYGCRGNKESEVSRRAARELGLRWEFVEYTNSLVYDWFHSGERRDYYAFADGLSSLPIFTNLIAVKKLKEDGIVAPDSIFVPGHTIADLINPSDVWDRTFQKDHTIDDLVSKIIAKHYALWPWDQLFEDNRGKIRAKIKDIVTKLVAHTENWEVNALDSWGLSNWVPNFFANSNRVYEFFGYEWYLPLWDKEFFDFWLKIPFSLRQWKAPFKRYTDRLYEDSTGFKPEYFAPNSPIVSLLTKSSFKVPPLLKKTKNCFRWHSIYSGDPLCVYGMIKKYQFKKLYSGKENKFSFYVLERLGKVRYE